MAHSMTMLLSSSLTGLPRKKSGGTHLQAGLAGPKLATLVCTKGSPCDTGEAGT